MSVKTEKRIRRHKKIRMNMHGTKDRPRLFVFRSNQHIYAQLVDDDKAKILMSASDKEIKAKKGEKKSEVSKQVGKLIAKKAVEAKIGKVIFDRGGTIYHGRIKALADGAREGGLVF
ncbi:MAG: 50S ribosomal protein L18 [Candidatus Staskawiczbacteria bacterium]|nr:50S ribosomal protein L18 [Candidatus Staskawiczbacteria bacterium]